MADSSAMYFAGKKKNKGPNAQTAAKRVKAQAKRNNKKGPGKGTRPHPSKKIKDTQEMQDLQDLLDRVPEGEIRDALVAEQERRNKKREAKKEAVAGGANASDLLPEEKVNGEKALAKMEEGEPVVNAPAETLGMAKTLKAAMARVMPKNVPEKDVEAAVKAINKDAVVVLEDEMKSYSDAKKVLDARINEYKDTHSVDILDKDGQKIPKTKKGEPVLDGNGQPVYRKGLPKKQVGDRQVLDVSDAIQADITESKSIKKKISAITMAIKGVNKFLTHDAFIDKLVRYHEMGREIEAMLKKSKPAGSVVTEDSDKEWMDMLGDQDEEDPDSLQEIRKRDRGEKLKQDAYFRLLCMGRRALNGTGHRAAPRSAPATRRAAEAAPSWMAKLM